MSSKKENGNSNKSNIDKAIPAQEARGFDETRLDDELREGHESNRDSLSVSTLDGARFNLDAARRAFENKGSATIPDRIKKPGMFYKVLDMSNKKLIETEMEKGFVPTIDESTGAQYRISNKVDNLGVYEVPQEWQDKLAEFKREKLRRETKLRQGAMNTLYKTYDGDAEMFKKQVDIPEYMRKGTTLREED